MNYTEISRPERARKQRGSGLERMNPNLAERRKSRFYRPAPWGDKELGEILDIGKSPTRERRYARRKAS